MPREFRKRGRGGTKKNKPSTTVGDDNHIQHQVFTNKPTEIPFDSSSTQFAFVQIEPSTGEEANSVDDFPVLTPDQRAYWKEIDEKLQEFERLGLDSYHSQPKALNQPGEEEEEDEDERKLLLRTALTELCGQELALACDPETTAILERIIFSMDGFAMRVLLDRLVGRFVDLCYHRNASHAVESLLTVSVSVLDEEAQLENSSHSDNYKQEGQEDLPTLTALLSQACEDMLPNLERLSYSPSASHVLLAILLLCFGKPMDNERHRSKKSRQWRSKQALFRPVFNQQPQKSQPPVSIGGGETQSLTDPLISLNDQRRVPEQLRRQGDRLYSQLRKNWCDNNGSVVRTVISNPTTISLLQLLIELEFDKGEAEIPGSLTDIITDGLFQNTKSTHERSDFVEVSLRDVNASRVIEEILSRLSPHLFARFHHVYLMGRIGHLCGHPVANFMITKVVSRLDREALLSALNECKPKMVDCIDNYRTGFLKALVERSASLDEKVQEEVVETILKAFGIESESEYRWIFPCLISLMRLDYFRKTTVYNQLIKTSNISQDEIKLPESNIQGSLLLQAIVNNMPSSVNKIITKGISDLPLELIVGFSRDPISSRALDSLLHSPSINSLTRHRFILRFIGRFHELADDRIGSRIAEACWAVSDVYLKEKIANSLVSSNNDHQIFLQKSSYGHYFLKKLELPLFERQRSTWKQKMASKYPRINPTINNIKQFNGINLIIPPAEKNSIKESIDQPALSDPLSPPSTNSDSNKKQTNREQSSNEKSDNKKSNDSSLKRKRKKNQAADLPLLPSVTDQIFDHIDQKKKKKSAKKQKSN